MRGRLLGFDEERLERVSLRKRRLEDWDRELGGDGTFVLGCGCGVSEDFGGFGTGLDGGWEGLCSGLEAFESAGIGGGEGGENWRSEKSWGEGRVA